LGTRILSFRTRATSFAGAARTFRPASADFLADSVAFQSCSAALFTPSAAFSRRLFGFRGSIFDFGRWIEGLPPQIKEFRARTLDFFVPFAQKHPVTVGFHPVPVTIHLVADA
jgi:hypothetical protein